MFLISNGFIKKTAIAGKL